MRPRLRETAKRKECTEESPAPTNSAPTSPLCYAAIVILALALGFALGLAFFPTLVDSPRDYKVLRSSEPQQPKEQVGNTDELTDSAASQSDLPSTTASTEKKPKSDTTGSVGTANRLFTKEELKQYDGSDESKPIYLAILGKVFDVSRGKQYYGPGGGYWFFAGRDGTRAFVSGNFTEEGLVEDVTGLDDVLGLEEWVSFYTKDYKYVGKLIGHFYDEEGKATKHLNKFNQEVEAAKRERTDDEEQRKIFPPCNSHWAQDKGGSVWCSTESGGIKRDWEGVPRRYYEPGTTSWRCVCVRTTGPPSFGTDDGSDTGDLAHPHLKLFDNCPANSVSCALPKDA